MLNKYLPSSTLARVAGVAVAVGMAISVAPVSATPTLRYSTDLGATWTAIADGSAGDASSQPGLVTVIANPGIWSFIVSVGATKPILGSALMPDMDLAYTVASSQSGNLLIEFSETDFLATPGNFLALIGGTAGAARAGSYNSFETFIDPTNALFGTSGGPFTQYLSGAGAFSDAQSKFYAGGQPYSMTIRLGVFHSVMANSSGDAQLLLVPEPGTVAMLGLGLLGLAGFARRRSNS